MKPNLLPFLRERWQGIPDPKASFSGKSIVVIGANSGIGLAAAAKFVTLDAERVVLGVRNLEKGRVAQAWIEDRTSRKGVVEVWKIDMDSYASVQEFAQNAERSLSRVDVLVLNAGVSPARYREGREGWETSIQVNVLSTALLGILLLPKLRRSGKTPDNFLPHLVVVSSEAHRWLEQKDIPSPDRYRGSLLKAVNGAPSDGKNWDAATQYSRSKLFTMYVAKELAALATNSKGEIEVVVVSVCPGACKSNLARDMKASGFGWALAASIFEAVFGKTAEEGARAYVCAALLGKEAQAAWWKTRALTTPGYFVTSLKGQEMQRQVWQEIIEELEKVVPSVRQALMSP